MAGSCSAAPDPSAQIDGLQSVQTYISAELEELKKAIDKEKRENQANCDFCNKLTDDIGMIQDKVAELQIEFQALTSMQIEDTSKQKQEHGLLKQEVAWCRGTLLRMLQEKLEKSPPEKLCPHINGVFNAVRF